MMNVRNADYGDARLLAAFVWNMLVDVGLAPTKITKEEFLTRSEMDFQRVINAGEEYFSALILEDEGSAVGCITLSVSPPWSAIGESAFIDHLYIMPGYRDGMHSVMTLCRAIIVKARSMGITRLEATITPGTEKAFARYGMKPSRTIVTLNMEELPWTQ